MMLVILTMLLVREIILGMITRNDRSLPSLPEILFPSDINIGAKSKSPFFETRNLPMNATFSLNLYFKTKEQKRLQYIENEKLHRFQHMEH